MHIASYLLGHLAFAILLLSGPSIAIAQDDTSGEPFAEPSVTGKRKWSEFVVMPAIIAEKSIAAMIDTGSSNTLVQTDSTETGYRDRPFRTVQVSVAGQVLEKRAYLEVPVDLNGCGQHSLDVGGVDLTVIPPLENWQVEAIIGMDYLNSIAVEMRHDVMPFETVICGKSPSRRGKTMAISIHDRLPHIRLTFPGGMSINAMIDTGMTGTISLPKDVLRRLNDQGHLRKTRVGSKLTGRGRVETQLGIIRWCELAETRLTDIEVSEGSRAKIGLGLLRHFNCMFDFANRIASLEPISSEKTLPVPTDASGLLIWYTPDGRAFIPQIMSEYPGNFAGIATDDELLSIDGVPVAELSIYQIDDILAQAGETVHLKLKSGEREYEVDLKLDRPFEYPPKWEPEDPNAAPRPFPKLEPEKK